MEDFKFNHMYRLFRLRSSCIAATLCLFCLAGFLEAQQGDAALGGLSENSPFIPGDFKAGGLRTPGTKDSSGGNPATYLQLIGIIELENHFYFCIHNTRTGKSSWLGLKDSWEDVTLVDYDANEYSVLTKQGESFHRLKLANANVAATRPAGSPLAGLPPAEIERRRQIFQQFSMIPPNRAKSSTPKGVVRRNPRPKNTPTPR